ncbi:uncharacterized protein PITG_16393 [Phytophthora infestans T30-4]|uniref:F-box domain-containing protein n=1 Tax=Phytophthora infestans (strain T30-4) TaxID=403677 RepID=D0NU64_PHYIT|nr:uncharacterized protein PITG_16393 [Phytophthora infestans T30-4]EEY65188.1 conserved hypothetical protein [Phytophthora infestans T30-4]|eukprot:XP_002897445.1 conserved hypothetical protein [Phytophthora infestans T30-4]
MLLELADECKQHIWEFMDVQELCRVACVARNAEQGVCLGPIWQKRARTLLSKGQEALDTDTGVLSCRDEDKLSGMYDTFDWRLWSRDTHLTLGRFSFSNTRFAQAMSSLQDLKRERSQLKEAMQSVKASSHADKRTRRLQMNCVKWMNRTHRRQAAASQSIQAQNAALSKAELASRLQQVENMIQTTAQEQFGLRKRAMKSLHKFNTQLATGSNLFYDLGALQLVA